MPDGEKVECEPRERRPIWPLLSDLPLCFFTLTTITISSITIIIIIINSIVFVIISAPRLFVMFCLDSQGCGKSNCKLNAQIFCPWMFTFSAICLRRCSRDLSLRVFCLPVHMWGPNAHVHASTSCVFSNPQPTTQHHNTHHPPTHQLAQTHTPTPSNTQFQYQYPIPTNMH